MIRRIVKFVIATEATIVEWKARNGMDILRVSLGIVFFWFGVLKFFHGLSAAEVIAGKTILKLSFGYIKPVVSLPILACWECIIGLGLIFKRRLSFILVLLYFQMAGTALPLFFFPDETWTTNLFAPTLLGQYIIKNIVLLSAGILISTTVQEKRLIANDDKISKELSLQLRTPRYKRRFKRESISN
ncbi:hypothetical protein SAMN05216490_1509 [Mucilaginibacter mallensis]|uniref:DoxX protein n=1 Tax=Mucilaginibacter mallensis TaxID=652787 RepID=A0A1H1TTC8_MUCMA|nr:hypothetical protein [Mucilaginibacter mallensis]SDS63176.1 hypothetical protein SAMN05216490_1509 [Mucilaginibacter mallensis]